MKKLFLVLLASLGFGQFTNAQYFEWVKSIEGRIQDGGTSVSVDASGNVYTTGYFSGSVDFDPGAGITKLTSAGVWDVFVQKMDASGNFLWAKSFGNANKDHVYSISVDESDNVYISGSFTGTVDFDPGADSTKLTSAIRSSYFVQKMDASGNFLWAKTFGQSQPNYPIYISVDASGNVYTTGYFYGTADFEPGAGRTMLISVGISDVFVQKMDASGNFLWAKSFGSSDTDVGTSVSVDASGNVYTTGHFSDSVDFDPGAGITKLTSAGGWDVFVQKLDADGNFQWAKSFGAKDRDGGTSVSVDASGNVYTIGFFEGTVDFDPGEGSNKLTSAGKFDVFVQKMDASGNFLWAKSFGNANNDYVYSISVDVSGNVYTTGDFSGSVDFDPGAGITKLTSAGDPDDHNVFIQKLDTDGNFLWAKSFGATNDALGISISVDASGNVYTMGDFKGTLDFDPGAATVELTSTGSWDVFVQKLFTCTPNTSTHDVTACKSFTWIDGNTYAKSNNSSTHTLTNTSGCDSVVTLNLTINNEIAVYPNPNRGNFSIDLGCFYEKVQVTISDMSGKVLQTETITQSQMINTSINARAGMYVISIQAADKKNVLKIVKL